MKVIIDRNNDIKIYIRLSIVLMRLKSIIFIRIKLIVKMMGIIIVII